MRERLATTLVGGCLLVAAAACTSSTGDGADPPAGEPPSSAAPTSTDAPATTIVPPTTEPPTTETPTTEAPTTLVTTTTMAPSTTTTTEPPTTTTTPPTTAPTTTVPARPGGGGRRQCVVVIRPGDSLSAIADSIRRKAVTVESLQAENGIADPDTINAGDRLDVCVGNDIDDITGKKRVAPPPPPPVNRGIQAQQQKLNELFAGYGLPALAVDGDSGPLTEQQLCAARLALGLPVSRADMQPRSAEARALMAADSVPIPAGAPVDASRWALIDRTCQVVFLGEGSDRVVHVFTASTGEPGYGTRDQNGSRVFRYDPATENNGWHNSSVYPVSVDNPLNGNMYLPLYFDNGQAIHGANTVPTYPASKGCVRLRVESQNALVDWLGLGGTTSPIWDSSQINLSVSVQGEY